MEAPSVQLNCLTDNVQKQKEIAEVLRTCGCCPRCILRFLGEKDPIHYRPETNEIAIFIQNYFKSKSNNECENSHDEESMEIQDSNSADHTESSCTSKACVVCLGILQSYMEQPFLNKLKEDITSADYQFSSYICSLTIPVCLLLRERALLVYLTEKFRSEYETYAETDFSTIKDIWKWRMGPLLGDALGAPFELQSDFKIRLNFTYARSDRECSVLIDSKPDMFLGRKLKKGQGERFNQTNVSKALQEMGDTSVKRVYQCPPKIPAEGCQCDAIRCSYDSVYIAGRYNKYSRTLSQTPWFFEGERRMESSVEEKICDPLKRHFKFDDHRFSSSGREDVDVQMLGSGRPFVIEMLSCHRVIFTPEQIASIQKEINTANSDIQIRDLQIVKKEATNNLKEGEMEKTKVYTALCWCAEPIAQDQLDKLNGMKDITLKQKTPVRVLHRRPLAVRERVVYNILAIKKDDHHFTMDLSTQSGTYIKEFVHGDFGRTKPNLNMLMGVECDILELDVKAVELDWPKSLDNT